MLWKIVGPKKVGVLQILEAIDSQIPQRYLQPGETFAVVDVHLGIGPGSAGVLELENKAGWVCVNSRKEPERVVCEAVEGTSGKTVTPRKRKLDVQCIVDCSAEKVSQTARVQTKNESPGKPLGFESDLGSFEALHFDNISQEPVAWGFRLLTSLSKESLKSLRQYGSLQCLHEDEDEGDLCLLVRHLSHNEAISKYGAPTRVECGPNGAYRACTYGNTMFSTKLHGWPGHTVFDQRILRRETRRQYRARLRPQSLK